jgi:hypothetical protein
MNDDLDFLNEKQTSRTKVFFIIIKVFDLIYHFIKQFN